MYFSKREKKRAWDRRSEAWNKRSTVSTKNQMLEVIPEKREKGDGGYAYCIYLCLCILDTYATEPWYLDILLYPVTLTSHCMSLTHVRAIKLHSKLYLSHH
jgi:hypothetical protein